MHPSTSYYHKTKDKCTNFINERAKIPLKSNLFVFNELLSVSQLNTGFPFECTASINVSIVGKPLTLLVSWTVSEYLVVYSDFLLEVYVEVNCGTNREISLFICWQWFPYMEFAVHTVPAIQLSYNSLYSSRDLLLKSIYNLKCDWFQQK